MQDSIRKKLIKSNLVLVGLSLLAIFSVAWYYLKKDDVLSNQNQLQKIQILLLEDVKIQRDFFANETINPDFFRENKSLFLEKYNQVKMEIYKAVRVYKTQRTHGFYEDEKEFNQFEKNLEKFSQLFEEIVIAIRIRGFKDDGIEGMMRVYAHNLEKSDVYIDKIKLLQMRRNEKDYIVRHEENYITQFNDHATAIKKELNLTVFPKKAKDSILAILRITYSFLVNWYDMK
jgi:hypothetical protein